MSKKPYLTCCALDIYHVDVYFFLEPEAGIKFAASCGTKVDEDMWRTGAGVCSTDFNVNKVYVGIFTTRHGTVSHEIGHACVHILARCGIPVETDNHEALTYLISYVTDHYYAALELSLKKRGKRK